MTSASKRSTRQSGAASRRAERRLIEERHARNRRLMIAAGAAACAILTAVVLILVSQRGNNEAGSSGLPAIMAARPIDETIPSDRNRLGNPDAPVVLVEWADYQCPFCRDFSELIMPRLIEEYIKPGKVLFEYRDLAFLDDSSGSDESNLPAEAAAYAADSGDYWIMHDTIYVNQFGENKGAYSSARITEIARTAGLEMEQFTSCMEADTHADEVEAMRKEAEAAGINSTPSLFLNGQRINYTGEYNDLKAEIDAILSAQ
jgi:protein-disulfide isomerase